MPSSASEGLAVPAHRCLHTPRSSPAGVVPPLAQGIETILAVCNRQNTVIQVESKGKNRQGVAPEGRGQLVRTGAPSSSAAFADRVGRAIRNQNGRSF